MKKRIKTKTSVKFCWESICIALIVILIAISVFLSPVVEQPHGRLTGAGNVIVSISATTLGQKGVIRIDGQPLQNLTETKTMQSGKHTIDFEYKSGYVKIQSIAINFSEKTNIFVSGLYVKSDLADSDDSGNLTISEVMTAINAWLHDQNLREEKYDMFALLMSITRFYKSSYANQSNLVNITELVEYKNETAGYSIDLPYQMHNEIVNNAYLHIYDDSGRDIIIWPFLLSGNYSNATALNVANYLIGNLSKKYTNFIVDTINISQDNMTFQLIANFTENGVENKGVFTVIAHQTGEFLYGFLIVYDMPKNQFNEYNEALLRAIIDSYEMIQPTDSLNLTEWNDVAFKMNVPKNWTAKAGGDCSTRSFRVYDAKNASLQVFWIYSAGPSCQNQDVKNYYSTYYNIDCPLVSDTTPKGFLTQSVPAFGSRQWILNVFSGFPNMSNVLITAEQPAPSEVSSALSLAGGTAKIFNTTFIQNNTNSRGVFLAYSTSATPYGWWGGTLGISAPANDYEANELLLLKIVKSIRFQNSWLTSCASVSNYQAEIISQVFQNQAETINRINEKWDDVILERERVFDPEDGNVYHMPSGFYEYYEQHRTEFEHQNLRPLTNAEWNEIPLDGQFHIS